MRTNHLYKKTNYSLSSTKAAQSGALYMFYRLKKMDNKAFTLYSDPTMTIGNLLFESGLFFINNQIAEK